MVTAKCVKCQKETVFTDDDQEHLCLDCLQLQATMTYLIEKWQNATPPDEILRIDEERGFR